MLASGHFALKREVLDRLGEPLFDAALQRREDFDLYLRLRARGVEVYKCDRIVAFSLFGEVFLSDDAGDSWSSVPRAFGEIRTAAWLPAA